MRFDQTHRYDIQVQFEEVDAGGVVHHPNYLRYYERARIQALEDVGISHKEMMQAGQAFAVTTASLQYKKPLFEREKYSVYSRLQTVSRASMVVDQIIVSDQVPWEQIKQRGFDLLTFPKLLNSVRLTFVMVSLNPMKLVPFPAELLNTLRVPQKSSNCGSSSR